MRRKVTIQDIASCTGVSKTTVSRYLNGKFEFMSEDTRSKIERAISETGYRPNRIANSLKTNRSSLIGVVMSNVMSSQTPHLLGSVCEACAEHGMKVIVINSEKNPEKERSLVYELLDQRVDGLLVFSGYNLEFYQELDQSEVPVVLADRVPPNSGLDSVSINHAVSTQTVINYLLDQGYENIVVLRRPHRNPYNTPLIRVKAAMEICRKRFGDDSHCDVITVDFNNQDIMQTDQYEEFSELLQEYYNKSAQSPTAIFIAEATIMNVVACCYYRADLSINKNFTIAGYSEWGMGAMIVPQISTIEQPIMKMGHLAAEKLIKRIEERKDSKEAREKVIEANYLSCRITLAPMPESPKKPD